MAPESLALPEALTFAGYDFGLAGSPHRWGDYAIGETIDHRDGMTLEEAEHQLATRLYQNTARVHFDLVLQKESRFGRRLVYGGHVISLARALSFNGLGNAQRILAINAGTHANPCFAGDTVYAWSEVLEKAPLAGRSDSGLLRLRTLALKDRPASSFPDGDPGGGADGKRDPAVLLDLDYWVALPA
jgi:2-methylfumaryl-CoA hydratase